MINAATGAPKTSRPPARRLEAEWSIPPAQHARSRPHPQSNPLRRHVTTVTKDHKRPRIGPVIQYTTRALRTTRGAYEHRMLGLPSPDPDPALSYLEQWRRLEILVAFG
ncbi:MAG: hypothetical protein Q9203_007792, partial [Teloschistes exilis]